MKLNPDCIRDVLLCVEKADFDEAVSFSKIVADLEKAYCENEVLYHINQCDYNGFFTKVRRYESGREGIILDLTPKAHAFLANIRSDTMWKRTKKAAEKVGSFALPALQQIASTLVEGAIKGLFHSQEP